MLDAIDMHRAVELWIAERDSMNVLFVKGREVKSEVPCSYVRVTTVLGKAV
jgi:hypothetical protein